uniref:Uncharacterized protein n=1 Tax=Nothobranchius kadleci TaxID=1051664 RepID=A0A1A8CVI8_NOTKA
MKLKLVQEIDSRWKLKDRVVMTSSLYILTAVLDPHFKQLPFPNGEKRDEAYSEVAQLAQRLSLSGDSTEQTSEDENPLAKKQNGKREGDSDASSWTRCRG